MARKRHRRVHKEPSKHLQEKPAERPENKPQEGSQGMPQDKPGKVPGGMQATKPRLPGDENHVRISVIVYTLGAIAMGYISLQISPLIGNMLTVFMVLIAAWFVGRVVQSIVGSKETKWLIGNGLFIYLFVWLIAWIFFFNLLG